MRNISSPCPKTCFVTTLPIYDDITELYLVDVVLAAFGRLVEWMYTGKVDGVAKIIFNSHDHVGPDIEDFKLHTRHAPVY